jgi:hypothetical protein
MKEILNDVVNILEAIATNLASMEATLIQKDILIEGEIDHHTPIEGVLAQKQLVSLRQMISALPNETPLPPAA